MVILTSAGGGVGERGSGRGEPSEIRRHENKSVSHSWNQLICCIQCHTSRNSLNQTHNTIIGEL